jgi:hypothetical protein
VVDYEEIPTVAEAVAAESQEAGVEKKFRAARLRLEYWEQGLAMHEDIYCVLTSAYLPAIRTTLWEPERSYSFKAEKGKLEGRSKIFQTVVNSYHPNFEWFNRYRQLVQLLHQTQLDTTLPVAELSRFVAQTTTEADESRRQSYQRLQGAQERINAAFNRYVRGVEQFRNPWDGHKAALPSGYQQVWANAAGDFLLTDQPAYDPNRGGDRAWKLAVRER